jgi:hypothetical protein
MTGQIKKPFQEWKGFATKTAEIAGRENFKQATKIH